MNQFLGIAIDKYQSNGVDFHQLLSWHLCHGVVLCDDRSFLLCYGSNSSNPDVAVQLDEADTFFCTFCAGDMRHAFELFYRRFKYVAFQREFDGSPRIRLYDSAKFMSKLKH